jgi:hypothetical protein
MTLKDQLFSPISIDALTLFSVRPPELQFVSKPALYFEWFLRDSSLNVKPVQVRQLLFECLSEKLTKSEWRDGTNHRIRVRSLAVPMILDFLREKVTESDFYADEQLEDAMLHADDTSHESNGVPINSTARYRTCQLFERLWR